MLSKTRTTVVTLVAAFSFAGAAMVPAVSQASPKHATKQTHEQLCESYEAEFNIFEEGADDPASSPSLKAGSHKAAAKVARTAIKAGCDTSAWRELPPETSPTILVPPGTVIQGTPGGTPIRVTARLAAK
jgi:hypothetical protein